MSNYISPPKGLPQGSVVWAYLRDSGGDAQEQSINQQRGEIQAYCQEFGLTVGHVFADEARSGGSVTGRESFLDLIDMSSHDSMRPDGLLLWNFARFSRDLDDSSYYKALLRKRGLIVHSLTDPIPEGPYSRVIETFIDIANEEKRHQTARDVKRALAAMTRQGYAPGGFPPRGYKAEKVIIGTKRDGKPREVSRWIPDPDLEQDVKLAWEMRARGKTYGEIQAATGGRLYQTTNSWTTFFLNKTYLGIGKCGELEIPDHHPALVDQETWNGVQQVRRGSPKFAESGHIHNPRRVASPSLLSGLAKCVHCGSPMVRQRSNLKRGNPWPYYICGKKVNREWKSCEGRQINARLVDQAVLDTLLNRILTVDFFNDLMQAVNQEMQNTEEIDREQADLELQLKEAERSIQNLLDLIEGFGARSGIERLKEREAEKGILLNKIRQIEVKREAAKLQITPDAIAMVLQFWREQLEDYQRGNDIRALRDFLARFFTKIELGYNKAVIWYTYPLNKALHPKVTPVQSVYPWGHSLIGCKAILVEWE